MSPSSATSTVITPIEDEPTPTEPSIVVTAAIGNPHMGDMAPDFDLPDQDGKRVSLASARGSVVVLAFVASFCPFSKAEQPYLVKLRKDYAGKNVRVIAIETKEPEADYREYVGRMPMGLPVLRDEDGAVALKFTPAGAQPDFKDRTQALKRDRTTGASRIARSRPSAARWWSTCRSTSRRTPRRESAS